MNKRKVLISRQVDNSQDKIVDFLKEHEDEFETELAKNGKDAQLKVYKDKYYAIILDLDTQNNSGLEVLKYIKIRYPTIKVLLTVESKKRLKDLEFSKNDLKKLGADEVLVRPYRLDNLLKALIGKVRLDPFKSVPKEGDSPHKETTIEASDEEFTSIKITEFNSGNVTIFDLYVRLKAGKYIKILHKGDSFDRNRIKKYEEKGVEFLYFSTNDRALYISLINNAMEKLSKNEKLPLTEKTKLLRNVTEKFIEEVYVQGIKPELVDEGSRICENIFNVMKNEKDLSKLLYDFKDFDNTAYSHVFLVSFFTSIICSNLPWCSRQSFETTVMGAFLHDIGKLKLPPELSTMRPEDMNEKQLKLYEQHPVIGAELLKNVPLIPRQVIDIVLYHHETNDGEGFPNGISGIKIFPLAKIVNLADAFANFIATNEYTPFKGINVFLQDPDRVKKYDVEYLKVLTYGFITLDTKKKIS